MDTTPENDADDLPLQRFLTYRLARAQAKLNAQGSRLLKEIAGISLAQWRIVSLIGTHGQATSSELTRVASIDKGLFSRNLKVLVQDGLVVATPDDADMRISRLKLSPKGQALYEHTLPQMRNRQRKLRAALTDIEAEMLFSALSKLEAVAEERDP